MDTITLPKKDAAERKVVTDAEVHLLIEACERLRSAYRVALCRALFAGMVYAGLRRAELLDLRVADVNLDDGVLLVRCGKGSKSRSVYLCEEAITAFREWLALRPKDSKLDWLYLLDRAKRVGQEALRSLVEEVENVAGLRGASHIVPHSVRHNFATRMLRNGADLRAIQALLGHADLRTTSIYLHADEARLKAVAHLSALHSPQQAGSSQRPAQCPQGEQRRSRRITR